MTTLPQSQQQQQKSSEMAPANPTPANDVSDRVGLMVREVGRGGGGAAEDPPVPRPRSITPLSYHVETNSAYYSVGISEDRNKRCRRTMEVTYHSFPVLVFHVALNRTHTVF